MKSKCITFYILFTLSVSLIIVSCSKSGNNTSGKPENKKADLFRPDSLNELKHYDLSSKSPFVLKLPKPLKEISGITMTPDGRLFAHQDEYAYVYQIDITSGEIIKTFSAGNPALKDDFEDIAFVNDTFYLLKNNGTLISFIEGENKKSVDYEIIKTGLKSANDAEGLCYDPETKSLLIALKGKPGEDIKDAKAVYSYSLENKSLNQQPRFILPLAEIKKFFNPSGIQRHPISGSFFIIAANGNEIIEISKEGRLLNKHSLLPEIHSQPEGITFGKDYSLIISNEGKDGPGYFVIYNYKK